MSQFYDELNKFTQENREIEVDTPLGKDVLLLNSFTGEESMSTPFIFRLEMLSGQEDIEAGDIVGENINIFVNSSGERRCFNGFVRNFAYQGSKGRGMCAYQAEIVPWLWFLTRHVDCRVFQNMTVVEIVEQIFCDLGFNDFSTSGLIETYDKLEYCVQYNESDYDFINRLLEQEGIYYYFTHEPGKHTLMLADHKTSHKFLDNKDIEHRSGAKTDDMIHSWQHQHQYFSGRFSQSDFDFEKFSGSLVTESQAIEPCKDANKFELYNYPGQYKLSDKGRKRTNLRMELEEVSNNWATGESSRVDMEVGRSFTLTPSEYPVDDGKNFVVTHMYHHVMEGSYIEDSVHVPYSNSFRCIPDSLTYRPALRTPSPVIEGVQTALVVGPSGEEIHTDKYGRIKIQFHWDRYGQKDDNSSCWVRVASQQAGKKWGVVGIPRVGHEVVVTFEGGNPDKPLIIGGVYNNENMPPMNLPASKSQTGFKSQSTKGSSGQNMMYVDDSNGKEEMRIHATYDSNTTVDHDMTTEVTNNNTHTVHQNSTERVDVDHSTSVGGDQKIEVTGNQTETVTGNQDITVKSSQTESITNDQTISAKKQTVTIKTDQDIETNNQTLTVKAKHNINAGEQTTEVKGKQAISAAEQNTDVKGKISISATQIDISAKAKICLSVGGTSITIDPTKIELTLGASSVKVDPMGVTVMGPKVTLN